MDSNLFIELLIFLILYIFFDEEGILTLFQHTPILKTLVCLLVLLFMTVELKKFILQYKDEIFMNMLNYIDAINPILTMCIIHIIIKVVGGDRLCR